MRLVSKVAVDVNIESKQNIKIKKSQYIIIKNKNYKIIVLVLY